MLARFILLALALLFFPLVQSQLVASLPRCVQDCIDQSGDDNCSVTDIKCLCRASAGNFLPDLVTCMHDNCDTSLDNSLLLTPLQFACQIAGTPIPDSAIQNAEDLGSSLAIQLTKTVTMGGPPTTGGGFEATSTVNMRSPSVSTVTSTTTEEGGATLAIVYPITEWMTTTLSGHGSTVTFISSRVSTYTTTDSNGYIITQSSTFARTTSASLSVSPEGGSDPTMIVTTSLAAAKTSSSQTSSSKTKTASSEDETNSSPFKDTNSAFRKVVGNWLGLIILLAMGVLWF